MKTMKHREVESSFMDPLRATRRRRRAGRTQDLGMRVLSQSGALTFLGLTLGVFVSRKFFIIPLAVAVTIAQEIGKRRLVDRFAG